LSKKKKINRGHNSEEIVLKFLSSLFCTYTTLVEYNQLGLGDVLVDKYNRVKKKFSAVSKSLPQVSHIDLALPNVFRQ
jgi:hypothetical protein